MADDGKTYTLKRTILIHIILTGIGAIYIYIL